MKQVGEIEGGNIKEATFTLTNNPQNMPNNFRNVPPAFWIISVKRVDMFRLNALEIICIWLIVVIPMC